MESNSNQIHDSWLKFDTNVPENIKPKILDLLPNCETVLTSFESLHNDGFSCTLRMDIKTKEHALAWLKEFQEISCTIYNADKTYSENSQKTVFKKIYHCLHNTRPAVGTKSPHRKHTNCQAKVMINVKNPDMKRSKDAYLKMFPCLVYIRFDHNHTINTADTYRHKMPQTDIEEKFKDLSSKGHSLSSALIDPEKKQLLYKVLTDKEVASVKVEDAEATVSSAEVSSMAMQENDKLQEIFLSLSKKLLEKPQLYLEPIKIFNSLFNDLKTDSSLISALHTFGKHSGGGMPIINKKKNLQGNTRINVHISASAHRKTTGRPAKEYSEHMPEMKKRKCK